MIDSLYLSRIFALLIGVILDLIFGDPYWIYHPVRLMGKIIDFEEKFALETFSSPRSKRLAGIFIVTINVFMAFTVARIIMVPGGLVSFILQVLVYYFSISARMLDYEARMVKDQLQVSLQKGRNRLSYIVGRDTENLSQEEVIKACVETVAENTNDGVIGPIFYISLFGPYGALAYKFINTMDSMIGYKSDKYLDLGRAAARLDDLVNFIPARLCGLFMCLGELRPRKIYRSLKLMLRDRKNHAGPNPAYPEGAAAAILGIQLGGPSYYKGSYVYKPTIGDKRQGIDFGHIDQVIRLMYRTEGLFLLFIGIVTIFLIFCK